MEYFDGVKEDDDKTEYFNGIMQYPNGRLERYDKKIKYFDSEGNLKDVKYDNGSIEYHSKKQKDIDEVIRRFKKLSSRFN